MKIGRRTDERGFVLPSIVIASVVLMSVLVAASSLLSGYYASINDQYYEQIAREAAESGVAHVEACWTDAGFTVGKALTPATTCSAAPNGQSQYMLETTKARTTYRAYFVELTPEGRRFEIDGTTEILRTSGVGVSKTKVVRLNHISTLKPATGGDRASKRYWRFGSAAVLNFGLNGSSMPTVQTSPGSAGEGVTTINDVDGNSVFWTNGLEVWDRTGSIMNSSGTLIGSRTGTQAVVAFPLNIARTKYGIISNTAGHCGVAGCGDGNGPGSLYLSIVDFTDPAYPNGRLVSQNQRLGGALVDYSSEALGAVPKADGTGYYVYTYTPCAAVSGCSLKIIRFFVSNSGTFTGPTTISPATQAPYLEASQMNPDYTGYGTFNFSDDYRKMIVMVGTRSFTSTTGTAYLFDVDILNGNLSIVAGWNTAGGYPAGSGYSADFSPNLNYVYVTQIYNPYVTRYDITSRVSSTIKASEWRIGNPSTKPLDSGVGGGQIRRGPDGRMYIANNYSQQLTYINYPDATGRDVGAIGFELEGLTLAAGSESRWGLPQMVTVYEPGKMTF